MLAGALYALYHARHESSAGQIAELIGGAAGGWLGGVAPDLLEPALHPRHRGVCHSWTTLSVLGGVSTEQARHYCRNRAALRTPEMNVPSHGPPAPYGAECLIWLILAGLVTGLQAGYVSHLALDARTTFGLPLLNRC